MNETIISISLVVIPALITGGITYFVAQNNFKNDISKIEKQYEYDKKRENERYLLTKRVEEASKLISAIETVNKSITFYIDIVFKNNLNQDEVSMVKRYDKMIDDDFLKIRLSSNYFSDLKKEIDTIMREYNDIYLKFGKKRLEKGYLDNSDFDELDNEIREFRVKMYSMSNKISKVAAEQIRKLEEA